MEVPKGRNLLHEEVEIVRQFLITIGKQRKDEDMGNIQEACNMAFVAGTLQSVTTEAKKGFCLIDPGGDTKYIKCTVFESAELAAKLGKFAKGDFIKVVGFLRAWSVKKDEGWQNNLEVRITEIKNEPPKRQQQSRQPESDGFPF